MILLLPLLACVALVAWNVIRWPAVQAGNELSDATVSVLVPARNEESNIAACLDAVLQQRNVVEVLVYDDESSDKTRDIVTAYADQDRRVRLAANQPFPAGWSGKTFACSRLAAQADCQWLLFLDADARLAPGAVPGMVAAARARSATFLSCWPGLEMHGFWEKLLMPMLNFVVFSIYPACLGLWRRDPALGIAHGACIVALRSTYESVGGHTAVASEIFEDTRLAQIWRERGEKSVCLDGQDVVRVRMYDGPRQIWFGFQKNFRSAFRTSFGFWAFLLLHAFLFLGPFVSGRISGALLVVAARMLLAWRFRQPLWSAILHPFAECFLVALGLSSWWQWHRDRGVAWKGRIYRPGMKLPT